MQLDTVIMHSYVVLLDKFLVTVVAVEWFLSNLNSVHSQVIILAEFLVTVVEVEWFFTSVILLYF